MSTTDSATGDDVDIERDDSVDAGDVARELAARWKLIVVAAFSLWSAWYLLRSRGATLVSAILFVGALALVWFAYRGARRDARID